MNFREHEVNISIDSRVALRASLCLPNAPRGIVLLAQGSGSSRHAPRNRQVASALQERGLATLLIDLLTAQEERQDRWSHQLRFDVPLLGGRLLLASLWLRHQPDIHELPIGLFGASTGAAAAIVAAAHDTDRIRAVVTRGGRIDLPKDDELSEVRAPTLIIVGGADVPVLAATRKSLPKLRCPIRFEIIPGAAHLFEQPGALDQVARLAADWFALHLAGAKSRPLEAARPSAPRSAPLSRH